MSSKLKLRGPLLTSLNIHDQSIEEAAIEESEPVLNPLTQAPPNDVKIEPLVKTDAEKIFEFKCLVDKIRSAEAMGQAHR